MPKIKSPETFVPNTVLTAAANQNHVDGAYPLPGFISEHADIGNGNLVSADSFLVLDVSVSELRKVTVEQLFGAGSPVFTNSITGTSGNLVITPFTGQTISLAGNTSVTGTFSVSSTATIDGKLTLNGTGAFKIPVGTTTERPGSPVTGDIRYNTTDEKAEVWNGTVWKGLGSNPFEATGGTVTTGNGWKVHTFTSSGNFVVGNEDGQVEILVVGGGGSGGDGNINNVAGGGGGAVVYQRQYSCTKNTTISVTVGAGGSNGNGGTSSFGAVTASGGSKGYYPSGGTSGNGNAGGGFQGGGLPGGGGGGAGGNGSTPSGYHPHLPGVGISSQISGTNVMYGCGGGGGMWSFSTGTPNTTNFADGRLFSGCAGVVWNNSAATRTAITPAANTGNGGQGNGNLASSDGAAGVVIVRYRIP